MLAGCATFADELVAFQSGGDLVIVRLGIFFGNYPVRAEDLSHATQIDGLWSIVVQRNDVLDGTPQIRFPLCRKQDST